MILLALDQSTSVVGYAVVDASASHRNTLGLDMPGKLIKSGILKGKGKVNIHRALDLGSRIKALAVLHNTEVMAIEGHTYSTMKQREAVECLGFITSICRHVALDLLRIGEPVRIETGTMKKIAGGHGRADKDQIRAGTCRFWGLNPKNVPDDNEADALGIAQAWLETKR